MRYMRLNTNIKKVLLISPPWYRLFGEESPYSPLGLCYIGGVLEKYGAYSKNTHFKEE